MEIIHIQAIADIADRLDQLGPLPGASLPQSFQDVPVEFGLNRPYIIAASASIGSNQVYF